MVADDQFWVKLRHGRGRSTLEKSINGSILETIHPGMAQWVTRRTQTEPNYVWQSMDNNKGNYTISKLLAKKVSNGQVSFQVEEQSPVDCSNPRWWTNDSASMRDLVQATKFTKQRVNGEETQFYRPKVTYTKVRVGSNANLSAKKFVPPDSHMFDAKKHCVIYCVHILFKESTGISICELNPSFIDEFQSQYEKKDGYGSPSTLARAKNVVFSMFRIRMKKEVSEWESADFLRKGEIGSLGTRTFIIRVSENRRDINGHCILVIGRQVFDLHPRYRNIDEMTDRVWEVFNVRVPSDVELKLKLIRELRIAPTHAHQMDYLSVLIDNVPCHGDTRKHRLFLFVGHLLRFRSAVVSYATDFYQRDDIKVAYESFSMACDNDDDENMTDVRDKAENLNELMLGGILTKALATIKKSDPHYQLEVSATPPNLLDYYGDGERGLCAIRKQQKHFNIPLVANLLIESLLPHMCANNEHEAYKKYHRQFCNAKKESDVSLGDYMIPRDIHASLVVLERTGHLQKPTWNDPLFLGKKEMQTWFEQLSDKDQKIIDTAWGKTRRGFCISLLQKVDLRKCFKLGTVDVNKTIQQNFSVKYRPEIFYLTSECAIDKMIEWYGTKLLFVKYS